MVKNRNFLFVTDDINIDFMVIDCKEEGNNVRLYSKKWGRDCLSGFLDSVERVSNWRQHVKWADVIVFDDVGWGKHADRLRRKGKAVVGGSEYTDRLELDREFGQKELARKGLKTLREWQFKSPQEVVKFIKKNPGRYVLKPCGVHDMDTTIVGESSKGEDLVEVLKHMREVWKRKVKAFFLQEYVSGVEVEPGATFNGIDFEYPTDISFEHKRLANGDLGPMTWEMGTLMFYAKKDRLFRDTLLKFKEEFKKAGYIGDVGLNCIVNEKGVFPLEFTCRFGFPATQILWEGDPNRVSDYLWNLAHGLKSKKPKMGYHVGVTVVVPPFPYRDLREERKYWGMPIIFKDDRRKGVYFVDVLKRSGRYYLDGFCPLIVVAKEKTVKKARDKVYRRIEDISIENMYYRTDIAAKWERESKQLRKWGYL